MQSETPQELSTVKIDKKEYHILEQLFEKYPSFFNEYKSESIYVKKSTLPPKKYIYASYKNDA